MHEFIDWLITSVLPSFLQDISRQEILAHRLQQFEDEGEEVSSDLDNYFYGFESGSDDGRCHCGEHHDYGDSHDDDTDADGAHDRRGACSLM